MSVSFIAIHSYILKYVAPQGPKYLKGGSLPHPTLLTYNILTLVWQHNYSFSWKKSQHKIAQLEHLIL